MEYHPRIPLAYASCNPDPITSIDPAGDLRLGLQNWEGQACHFDIVHQPRRPVEAIYSSNLMRYTYFLVLVLVTIAASVQANENILQTSSLKTNSGPAIGRNLKGSVLIETEDGEERNKLTEMIGNFASGIKSRLSYFKPSTAAVNALKKNPSFTKLAKENDAIPSLLQKQPTLAKQLEDPKIATAVDNVLSNPSVVKSFKESEEVVKIAERLPTMSKELTPAKVEKMGEVATKTTFLSRGITDAQQQLTAWTLAVVGAIIIFIIGWNMARNN